MAVAHKTTVQGSADQQQHPEDGAATRRTHAAGSVGPASTAGTRRVRNLDNFDEKQTHGVLLNSPRSLLACAKEGVDPQAELLYRDLQSFVLPCKGDVEVAAVKHRRYMQRRAEAIEMVRERRRALIEETRVAEDAPQKSGSSAAPPAGRANSNSASEFQQQTSSTSVDREEDNQEPGAKPAPAAVLSPEEFQRQQAEAKRLKVARQVDKMKRVAEKNKQREEAQLEHVAATRRRLKQQEVERQEQLEREEVMRYLRERAARKRDAELAIQKEQREAATEARMLALQKAKEDKAEELRRRDEQRTQKEEERRLERERLMEEHREQQRQRLQQIYEQNEDLLAMRAEDLHQRMDMADELRDKLQRQRDDELRQRKEANLRKQIQSEEKRRKAEENLNSRIGRYIERATDVQQKLAEREEMRRNLVELRRLQEEEDATRRRDIRNQVMEQEKAHQAALQKRLEEEDAKRREENARRARDAKMRLAEKELEIDDRVAHVRRMQLRLEQECVEAGDRYEAKMRRIQDLRQEMHKADEDRKKLHHELHKSRLPPGAFAQPTPGPGEYAVVEAESKLAAPVPVSMGRPPMKKNILLASPTPGPGAYQTYSGAIRPSKGAKLPPRAGAVSEAACGGSTRRSQSAMSGSVALPSIRAASSRRSPSPRRSHTAAQSQSPQGGAAAAHATRPSELRDEDYFTDDDFEAA